MIGAGAGPRKRSGGASRLIFLRKSVNPRRSLRAVVERRQAEGHIGFDARRRRLDETPHGDEGGAAPEHGGEGRPKHVGLLVADSGEDGRKDRDFGRGQKDGERLQQVLRRAEAEAEQDEGDESNGDAGAAGLLYEPGD